MNRQIMIIMVLGLVLSLAACIPVGPNYVRPEIAMPTTWNSLDDTSQTRSGQADHSLWWRELNDPLLADLIQEALQSSPDLRLAQARLREARARRQVAEAGFFPSLSASGSGSRSQSSQESGSGQTRESYGIGLDATWELDVFGGVRRETQAAEADLEASQARLFAARVSLAGEVAIGYVEMRNLQERLRIAQNNLSSQTETLQLTRWRLQAGLADNLDSVQALANMEQTRAQIPALESSLAETRHSLDILLGKPPGTLKKRLETPAGPLTMPESVAIGIPLDTLRQRPDVLAAERSLAAETARIGVAEAARYPTFKLSGTVGLEALTVGALGNSGAETTSLLSGITTPLFEAGRLRAQVEIQGAVREQALATYEQTVLTALQEVEDALVTMARTKERRQILEKVAAAATEAAFLARQRYAAGIVDFQSVLDTERSQLSALDTLASAKAESMLALIRLYKALGGGWTPEPRTIKDIS